MKKIFTILLVLLSFTSFSQEYWRKYEIEKVILEQINEYRDSIGVGTLVYDNVNTTALRWADTLVKRSISNNSIRLTHCNCQPGGENLANLNASYNFESHENRDVDSEDFIKELMTVWLNSPLHKEVLGFNGHRFDDSPIVRHTVIVYMYEETPEVGYNNSTRLLVAYQNRQSKQYYIDTGRAGDI